MLAVECLVPVRSVLGYFWARAGLAVLLPNAVATVLLLSLSHKKQFLADQCEYVDVCVLLSLRVYSPCDSAGSCMA